MIDAVIRRRGIIIVAAADNFQNLSGLSNGFAKRSDLIERRSKGNETVAGYTSISGLKSNHSAERRRLANGAAGIGTEGEKTHARSNCCRRAAAAAAGYAIMIMRVPRCKEGRILGRRAHGKL